MPIRVVECADWAQFKTELFANLYPKSPFRRSLFLFRGARSADWKLESSFDRWFNAQNLSEELRVSKAHALLANFAAELKDFNKELASQSEECMLALGQHHGLPTRLLDWSDSPYIAAFFAFVEAAIETPADIVGTDRVAIWALDTQSYLWNENRGVQIVAVPNTIANRIRNQEGKFTLSRATFATLEEYVNYEEQRPKPKSAHFALIQFTIPDSEAEVALADLDSMGISPSRIYPDLEGCVMSAKLKSRLVDVLSRSRL